MLNEAPVYESEMVSGALEFDSVTVAGYKISTTATIPEHIVLKRRTTEKARERESVKA